MEISNYLVNEMSCHEQKSFYGGAENDPGTSGVGWVSLIFTIVNYVLDHSDSFKKGYQDGSSAANNFFHKIFN